MTLKFVGLHIGRTAGTSFYKFVENAIGMENCLPISAFGWGLRQGRVTPTEYIEALDAPLVTYGHYVHESWIEYVGTTGTVKTFSFYRDPLSRRRSLHHHLSTLDDASANSNLRLNLEEMNIWCAEVLRCFPTATEVFQGEPLWRQAFIALSAMDYLLPMTSASHFAQDLVNVLGNPTGEFEFPVLNGADETRAFSAEPGIDDQDMLLYEAISADRRASAAEIAELRDATRRRYAQVEHCKKSFVDHLNLFLRAEFESMATIDQNVQLLLARRRAIDETLRFLGAA